MKISILIPSHNEEQTVLGTVMRIMKVVESEGINYEIIVINDNSTDSTELILIRLSKKYSRVKYINNSKPNGFGSAVQKGLDHYTGDAAIIVMADRSDDPYDIIKYYRKLKEGCECVFGSRFIRDGKVSNYPLHKLILNRFGNYFIKILFLIDYDDITNAFKGYRREVLDGLKPLLSHHFNLTVELPLKAIVRGYSYTIVPISWAGRKKGIAKFKIREMGSRYLFIILYVFLEKLFSFKGFCKRDGVRKLIKVCKN